MDEYREVIVKQVLLYLYALRPFSLSPLDMILLTKIKFNFTFLEEEKISFQFICRTEFYTKLNWLISVLNINVKMN